MRNLLIVIGVCIVAIQLWALSFEWYIDWVMQSANLEVQVGEIIITPKNSE